MSALSTLAPAHLTDHWQAAGVQQLRRAMFALTLHDVIVEFAMPLFVADDASNGPSQDDDEAFRDKDAGVKDLCLLRRLRPGAIGSMVFLIRLRPPHGTIAQPPGGPRLVSVLLTGSTVNAIRPEPVDLFMRAVSVTAVAICGGPIGSKAVPSHPCGFVGLRWTQVI